MVDTVFKEVHEIVLNGRRIREYHKYHNCQFSFSSELTIYAKDFLIENVVLYCGAIRN